MKIPHTSVILAVVIAAVMLANISWAEMRLQISVFPVVDIYSGKLGPERTITTDDDLEQAVLQIFNAIKPKSAPLPSISFQMRPTTFELLTQWMYKFGLFAEYYEMLLGHGGGKSEYGDLAKMMVPIDHPSPSFFTRGKTYLMKIGKTGYHTDSVEFKVYQEQSGGPVFRFSRPSIHLTPLNYQCSGFIIESDGLRLAQSGEDRLRGIIGRGLENRHHELAWFRQYRTLDDLLKCIRQRPPINPTAQMSGSALQNYCGEKNLNYLIRISPGNGGE